MVYGGESWGTTFKGGAHPRNITFIDSKKKQKRNKTQQKFCFFFKLSGPEMSLCGEGSHREKLEQHKIWIVGSGPNPFEFKEALIISAIKGVVL